MAVTINREQRDAIYEEVLTDLSGVGDIWIAIDGEDYDKAQEYRRRFEQDMRLLDDLGWDRDEDRQEFTLSMSAANLADAIRHLNRNASAELRLHVIEPFERREVVERSVVASAAYSDVLALIASHSGANPTAG